MCVCCLLCWRCWWLWGCGGVDGDNGVDGGGCGGGTPVVVLLVDVCVCGCLFDHLVGIECCVIV